MTDAQNFLEMLASEGYSPEEIAEKLTSLGVKFIKEGDNFPHFPAVLQSD